MKSMGCEFKAATTVNHNFFKMNKGILFFLEIA
jgi:hypothetical protein